MKRTVTALARLSVVVGLCAFSLFAVAPNFAAAADDRPNILLIVADDLAYSDLGVFGSEIRTPVLDQLAAEGMAFSNFHVLPTCSPTRASLLSGNDNHVAGMGVMAEFIYPAIEGLPGYQGHLSDHVAIAPEILRDAGYHTYMAGKWHLGDTDDQSPFARGFEQTFALMNGGGSHWSDMASLSAVETLVYRRNGERITSLPEDFYSTKNYTDAMIEFIDMNSGDGRPFFGYLAYTAPHDPLHAPADFIKKYNGVYDEGWDVLAQSRLSGLKELDLVPRDLNAIPDNFLAPAWSEVSEVRRADYARDMEVYAAMVDYLDMSVGRLLSYIDQKGLADNTLVLFMSDNGANGALPTSYPGNADGQYLSGFDNSLDNRGLVNSFPDMGPGWAQAASVPFRYYKSFTSEGGIRAPLLARFPAAKETAGSTSNALVHVTDVLPTLLDAAGVTYPEEVNGKPARAPIGGSVLPLLLGEAAGDTVSKGIGYELFEMKAFLQDNWKLLRMPEPFGSGEWELFDLSTDPGEIHDVSATHPDVLQRMVGLWSDYARQNDVYNHAGYFDAIYKRIYKAK
jgi:arylsulfatase